MIDRLTNLTLTVIKSNVSIVLVFYVCGFLSFIAYYRVLGLPYISGNAQLYAELAGKNVIVILQTIILLISDILTFFQLGYLINIFRDSAWAGWAFYIWLISVFLLTVIYGTFKFFGQKPIIVTVQQRPYVVPIQLLLIAIVVVTVFYIETQPFYAENVLQQASQSNKLYQQKQNIFVFEKQTNKIDYDKRLKLFSNLNNTENKITEFFFSISKNYDELGDENKRIHALMLIVFIASITAIILTCYNQHTFVKWLIYVFTFAQVLFVPFNYGILGTKYQYPVISLDYSEKDRVLHKQAVFLLAKSQDSLIVYDRLNFFQINYIPQSSVISLEQQFIGSPFSNCSDGEFKPCEFFAIKP
jgi:hypothetical protein